MIIMKSLHHNNSITELWLPIRPDNVKREVEHINSTRRKCNIQELKVFNSLNNTSHPILLHINTLPYRLHNDRNKCSYTCSCVLMFVLQNGLVTTNITVFCSHMVLEFSLYCKLFYLIMMS